MWPGLLQAVADPSEFLLGTHLLFGGTLAELPKDISHAVLLAAEPELALAVKRFVVTALEQAHPTFLKHTDNYQLGGNVAEASFLA